MKPPAAIAEILKREGIDVIFGYPRNAVLEAAAEAGIRPVIVRQERTGIHMADAMSRMRSGRQVSVFCMQAGPGTENSFGAVAQAYAESVPLIVIPGGSARGGTWVKPAFNAALNFQHITKWCEQLTVGAAAPDALRRAYTQVRNGRPRPVLVEFPNDVWPEHVPEPLRPPQEALDPDETFDDWKNVSEADWPRRRPSRARRPS